jgi:hypothetical protein
MDRGRRIAVGAADLSFRARLSGDPANLVDAVGDGAGGRRRHHLEHRPAAAIRHRRRGMVDRRQHHRRAALTVVFGRRHFRVPFSIADVLRTLAACIPLSGFCSCGFRRMLPGWRLCFPERR